MQRGALLVLEGCDRVGKSTQAKQLVAALNKLGIKAESRSFPDRSTHIGSIINEFLSNKNDIRIEAAHLLFSANRWECSNKMKKTLESGTTLVVDRYAASGAAYTSAVTGRNLDWCKEADRGLPAPDFVALFTIDVETLSARSGWANERYEKLEIQKKVANNFLKLKDDTCVKNKPIKELYSTE
ncbi:thymidylate kinase [Aphidius gifuensis]|uniref:thymidylate kinase n=1 Tax=Aphidius gifuensis TaxID=684658 RepID=UPI001CDD548E|nr:thymidylate kinase [Aphidius gifuensis]